MDWINELFPPVTPRSDMMVQRLLLTLVVAFIIGQLNAWCYKWTHRGVSYSRTFSHAIVLIAIIAATSMSLVASNALVAVGLLGGLAIIRFRTVVRDARDTAYIFLSLICGMAAGFGFFDTAIIGAATANLVAVYLHLTGFGAWYSGEGLIRFRVASSTLGDSTLEEQLAKFCRKFSIISVEETASFEPGGEPFCQCAYKVRLRDPERGPDLVKALKENCHVDAVQLLVEQEHEEIA